MKIWISSLAKLHDTAEIAQPTRVVSLLGPGTPFPDLDGFGSDSHHRVEVDDDRKPIEGRLTPAEEHVTGVIRFLEKWDPTTPLLIHCWAGISRSTATAFIAACLHNPNASEATIAAVLAGASPTAFPNTRIVEIADELMARNGRMRDAANSVCSDPDRLAHVYAVNEAEPFFIDARH